MNADPLAVAGYYGRGALLERLEAALRDDGADPARPTLEALAPYDQFHGRGIEATQEIAAALPAQSGHHLLDIGSGLGGPARVIAHRFGCRITGIDLTAEFCTVALELTRRLGMQGHLAFECGNALAMPFADASFDGAYSMNVSMNIADKDAFYREIRRTLKPGGWLLLSELARGPGAELDFPVPWAETAATSFLTTPEETRRGLEACGFAVESLHENTAKTLAYAERAREIVKSGGKPPHRAIQLIHGDTAKAAMANSGRGVAESRVIPIEVLARKTS